jgi:hypothetical protein
MKTKFTLAAAMFLTIGSAVAGSAMLQTGRASGADRLIVPAPYSDPQVVTPEMIAKWKLTAATSDYTPPMLPI